MIYKGLASLIGMVVGVSVGGEGPLGTSLEELTVDITTLGRLVAIATLRVAVAIATLRLVVAIVIV